MTAMIDEYTQAQKENRTVAQRKRPGRTVL
jgi:hypothetical protein